MNHAVFRSARVVFVLGLGCVAVALWQFAQRRPSSGDGPQSATGGMVSTASQARSAGEAAALARSPHAAGPEQAAVALAEGTAAVLPADFLDRIVTGGAVAIPLPNRSVAVGAVEWSQRDAKGIQIVRGRLSKPAAGSFFFQRQTVEGVAGPMVGDVLFVGESMGWRVEPAADRSAAQLVSRHVDEIVCVDYTKPPEEGGTEEIPETHPTDIPIPVYQAVIPLQSLPGATGVVYLDFDGEKGPFADWGSYDAAPSGANNNQVFEVWKRVCEDFQGINLNITTDRKVYDNAPQGRRIHVVISPTNTAAPSAGGVAKRGSFNWTGDPVCWSFYSTGKIAAEVITHEVGHTLGLAHDGRTSPSETYYGGHGNDPVGWAPIMGVGYSKSLSQWSKGEYLNANNTQDDLGVIVGTNNDVDYRADDAGDTLATAKHLDIAADQSVSNEGIIGQTGDVDAFRFSTTGGMAMFNINTVTVGPNLDLLAEIVDTATSTVIATDNPDTALNAAFNVNLNAGEYMVRVRGTGRGDPKVDGYTNYSSLGSYTISGSVAGGIQADRFSLAENTANGAAVGTVVARNHHAANPLTWAIAAGNTNGAFAINANTGAITVANTAALNFEALSLRWDDPATIELFVTITDAANASLNENIRVVVTVTNVNEAPVLQGTVSTSILERSPAGTVIGSFSTTDVDHYDRATFAITAGNPGNAFAIDANGRVSVAANIEVAAASVYDLTITATDLGTPACSTSGTMRVNVVNIADGYQPGNIVRTFYDNISGTEMSDLTGNAKFPSHPDGEKLISQFDDSGHGEFFGATMRGYFIPPVSGTYQFWIAGTYSNELRFNANGPDPAGAVKIAYTDRGTIEYKWTSYASQQSATFNLVAGQPYYMESRQKAINMDTEFQHVACAGPGMPLQVIPGSILAPYYQNFAPKVAASSFNVYQAAPAGRSVGTVIASDVNLGGAVSGYSIVDGNQSGIFGIDAASGRIFVAQAGLMNAATTPTHSLVVSVADNGSPKLTTQVVITVNVFASNTAHIWANAAGGSWPTVGNWQNDSIADGDHHVADFSTLNLTANATVTLDGAKTIAGLKFADTTPSHDWMLNSGSGGTLTLSDISGMAMIDVANRTLTIGCSLGGTQGLKKTGAGSLVLTGGNSFTGPVTVSAGTLQIGNGTTVGSINATAPVDIAAGAVASWWRSDAFTLPNAISGAGQWILQGTNASNALAQSYYALTGNNSGFTGELVLNRARVSGVTSATQVGAALIRVQDRGQILVGSGANLSNAISIENGAGWHDNFSGSDVVFGAMRMDGTNTFSGNLQLNQNTGVVNGDNTGANSTLGAYGGGSNTFSGVISGTGELSMSRHTAQSVNIDLTGTSSNSYTGKTVVDGQGGAVSLRLMKSGGAVAIRGGNTVQLGSATNGQANLRMGDTTATGAARNPWHNQFGTTHGGVLLNFVNASGQWMRVDLQGTNQSVAGLNAGTATTQGGAVVQNQNLQAFDPGQDATLTLIGSGSYVYNGYLRDQDNGGTARKLHLVKSGSGAQTLAGAQISYSGNTTVNGGRLILTNGAQQALKGTSVAVTAGGTLEWDVATAQDLNAANTAFSGAGVIQKTGAGVLRIGFAGTNRNHTIQQSPGGVLDVQAGDLNIGWSNVALNANQGGLYLAAGAKLHNSQVAGMKFDWLSGSGDLNNAYNSTTPVVTIGEANTTNHAAYNVSGNTANFSGRIGYAETYNGVSVGTLSLVKVGTGTQILSGANGYTGTTSVNGGTLLINGSLANSATSVAAAATLGGTGTIQGSVAVNGVLAPGSGGSGTLTITQNTSFVAGSILAFELGSASDRVNITGNLVLDGTLNITDAGGFGPGTYTLFTYTGALTNNGLNIGTTPGASYQYAIDTATAGQVKLVVTSNAFSSWQMANFGSSTSAEAAATADPDGDSLPNLLEYLLGTNPEVSTQAAITSAKSGGNFVITFPRVDASENANLQLVVEAGNALQSWPYVYQVGATTASSSSGVIVTENDTAADTITVTIPAGSSPAFFFRLKAVAPN